MSDINIDVTEEALEFDITATGPKGARGNDGADGDSSYTYVAYASDNSGTDFSLTPATNLTFIAILTTDTEIPSPSAGDFAGLWQEYKSDIQNFSDLSDTSITDGAENDLLTLESGVWVNKEPKESIVSFLTNYRLDDLYFDETFDTTTGSASTSALSSVQNRHRVSSGATAGSTAMKQWRYRGGYSTSGINTRKTFNRAYDFFLVAELTGVTGNGKTYLQVGKVINDDFGDLIRIGFGVVIKNTRLFVHSHDGSTLNEVDSGVDFGSNQRRMRLQFIPEQAVRLYYEGSMIAESTDNIPSGNNNNVFVLSAECGNFSDSADQSINIHDIKLITDYD